MIAAALFERVEGGPQLLLAPCAGGGVIGAAVREARRVRDGTAVNPNAAAMEAQVKPLAETAWSFAEEA